MSESTPALTITARPAKGFRRCGMHHPASPVTHPAGTFTADQVAALKGDANLVVVEAPKDAGKPAAK
jgi:hypothetical protein